MLNDAVIWFEELKLRGEVVLQKQNYYKVSYKKKLIKLDKNIWS